MSYELMGYGLGSVQARENLQLARRKYPGAKRYSMSYKNGRLVGITPHYTRTSSAAREQHEALERQLEKIVAQEQADLAARLAQIKG